jgi:hypothetical protein
VVVPSAVPSAARRRQGAVDRRLHGDPARRGRRDHALLRLHHGHLRPDRAALAAAHDARRRQPGRSSSGCSSGPPS